jgi:hypothetical protein
MQVLKQAPVREVRLLNRVGNDSRIHRDVVQPFNCQRRDFLNCCRFSNTIEQLGVKPSAISCLENGARGFRLKMTSDSEAEYEVMLTDGTVKLGLVRSHQPRQLLASGSASAETTWTRFAEVIKEKEGK